jgi:membrane associated rhomboid family serine protease
MEIVIIPIGHDQSIRRMPWVTIGIIALCTMMQLYSTFGAPSEEELAREAMQIVARYTPAEGEEQTPEQLQLQERQAERAAEALLNKLPEYRFGYRTGSGLSLNLFTAAFVHGGWMHLIGNMLFLFLAGSALEDRYGRLRFAAFYLFGAAASTFAYDLTVHGTPHLLVGASGAISACMGAFLVHFRNTEITFWYFWMYRTGTFRWPAWFALPLWLVEQFAYSLLYSNMGLVSRVAYGAHIGGFVIGAGAGFAMTKLFPQDADDDDVEYAPVAPSTEPDPQVDERIRRCLDAIKARDLVTLRPLASRTLLDLARGGHDGRIVELYQAITKQIGSIALTDGAYAAVTAAADRLDDRHTFRVAAGAMMNDHAGSPQLPKVLWRLVQLQREAGEYEFEQETLRTLAQRFPRDPHGQKAQLELDRQA